jgi:hypothetical protein
VLFQKLIQHHFHPLYVDKKSLKKGLDIRHTICYTDYGTSHTLSFHWRLVQLTVQLIAFHVLSPKSKPNEKAI